MTAAASAFAAPVLPDPEQAVAFFQALFPQPRSGQLIHFRAVSEPKDGRAAQPCWYALDENFDHNVRGFLEYCAVDARAAFFLPGVVAPNGRGKKDVLALPAISIDFDKGSPSSALQSAEALIGPATIVLESGGITATGEPKLHAHWRLETPATVTNIETVCRIREELAKRFEGDRAFHQAAQIIRCPGSIHAKSEPKLVRLRTVREGATVNLSEVSRALGMGQFESAQPSNVIRLYDLNAVTFDDESKTDRVLTQPILAEAKSEDVTRFEGASVAFGHYIRQIREGRFTEAGARAAAHAWNTATLIPPWPSERVDTDFNRLLAIDIKTHGPFVSRAPVISTAATGLVLRDFYARRFVGSAPLRKWLVEGLLPLAVPTVFASVGDAGKSMLALRLAIFTSCYGASGGPKDISDPTFFGCPVRGRGTAVVITGEDDDAELHRRLESLDPSGSWRADSSRLIVLPLLSAGGVRAIITDGPQGPQLTPFWHELREQLESFDDLALVVLDPLSHYIGGDANDNTLAAAFMAECGALATATGATVMLVAHLNKGAGKIVNLTDARTAIRGASAFVDNSRAALVLWEANENEAFDVLDDLDQKARAREAGLVYFGGLTKGNAPGAKVTHTLVRSPAGVLEDVTDKLRDLAPNGGDVDAKLHALLLEHSQKHGLLSFTASPKALEAAWGQFIRKHNLPITREGKRRGTESITTVFNRLLDKGLLVQTADRGSPRYEPVPP